MDIKDIAAICGIFSILLAGANWVISLFTKATYGRLKEKHDVLRKEFNDEKKINGDFRHKYSSTSEALLREIEFNQREIKNVQETAKTELESMKKYFELAFRNFDTKIDFVIKALEKSNG